MKSGGHRQSWAAIFPSCPHLRGLKGGTPQKNFTYYFTKSRQITIPLKSEKKNNHVLYAKYCIIFISARVGGGPPMGDRVNPTFPGGEGGAIICFSDEFVVISPMYLNYHNCTYR